MLGSDNIWMDLDGWIEMDDIGLKATSEKRRNESLPCKKQAGFETIYACVKV